MATGKLKKNKKLKKLYDHHRYLSKKVEELTEERKVDRSSESKALLMRLKKTILQSLESNLYGEATMQNTALKTPCLISIIPILNFLLLRAMAWERCWLIMPFRKLEKV